MSRDETSLWEVWLPEPAGHLDPEDAIAAWMRARERARSIPTRRTNTHPDVVTTRLEKENTGVHRNPR